VFDNLRIWPISQEEINQCDRALCGLDFGFAADPDTFIRAHHDPRTGRITVLDEFYAVRTPVETLCAEVARRCGGAVVRCDSAEPRMIRELRERGVLALGAKKGPGSVQHGLRWLQERSEIRIDPARCPNAAREFAGYEYPDDGRGGIAPEPRERDNHLIDALRYAVEDVSSRKKAITLRRDRLGL
jgi:phage terminase large subunit